MDLDAFLAREVGDRTGNFEGAMKAARREAELLHRHLEKRLGRRFNLAVVPDLL